MSRPLHSLDDIRRAIATQDEQLAAAFASLKKRAGLGPVVLHADALERLAEVATPRRRASAAPPPVRTSGVRC